MVGRISSVASPRGTEETLEVGALYRAHAQTIARWAARLGGPGVDVEDVVQEVFLVVSRKLDGFRGESRVTTWLYRITANTVRHQRRKLKWRRWLTGSIDEGGEGLAERPTQLETLEQRRAARALYGALDRLPEKYRTPFILFEVEGLATEEISELLGVKLGTLWVRLHRAREQLKKHMERLSRPSSGSGGGT
jgi:RNA polymerase sigma-70 factor (ECF subfamily)